MTLERSGKLTGYFILTKPKEGKRGKTENILMYSYLNICVYKTSFFPPRKLIIVFPSLQRKGEWKVR